MDGNHKKSAGVKTIGVLVGGAGLIGGALTHHFKIRKALAHRCSQKVNQFGVDRCEEETDREGFHSFAPLAMGNENDVS